MNNEVRNETNLEHYKGELKEILLDDYDNPREIFRKISQRFDRQIKISPAEHYTDAILNWMAQPYEETVLDDVEKAYLRAVIKPFRNKVLGICLCERGMLSFISIFVDTLEKKEFCDCIELPKFKNGTMYKGMKFRRRYTLEELGL